MEKANEVAVHVYTRASFAAWAPPEGGPWGEMDEADEGCQMMATTVQSLLDAVGHRCRQRRLPPGVEILHFLNGEEVDNHVTVDPNAPNDE